MDNIRVENQECTKNGKTKRYKELSKIYKEKYKIEASKFLKTNIDELMESKPGQAYSILKKNGAQPCDCIDSNTFTLPGHESENLTSEQSAERISNYFSEISQEFPPLDINLPSPHLQSKLESESTPPIIDDYDLYQKIRSAKNLRSGVPGDLRA